MTVDELAVVLDSFSLTRRRALLFALEARVTPAQTVLLDWKTAGRMALSSLAAELLKLTPRHLRLNYCFWEYLEGGIAAPLFGLEQSIPNWKLMQTRYDDLLLIDTEAERIAFQNDFQALHVTA